MSKRISLIVLAALLSAAAAHAGAFYTVILKSGQTFATKYEPVDADWSDDVTMLLTDQGNWIALDKADIADITSELAADGIGERIGPATIVVGWGYNDGEVDGEDGVPADGTGAGPTDLPALLTGEGGVAPPAAAYTIEQFVNTGEAGGTGGIPVSAVVYQ